MESIILKNKLCGLINCDYSRWYLLTIGKSRKKEEVISEELQECLDDLIELLLGTIHVYEWVEEFGTMYHQLHMHCVVGTTHNKSYFYRFTKLNGFRLHWKAFPYSALHDVRHYIRKDIMIEGDVTERERSDPEDEETRSEVEEDCEGKEDREHLRQFYHDMCLLISSKEA